MSVSTSHTASSLWGKWRFWVGLGALLAVVAIIVVILTPTGQSRRLDPDDTSLNGAKSLAQLLRQRGVTVDRVDTVEAALAKGGNRLLLITTTAYIRKDQAELLAGLPGDRVLIGAGAALETLAPGVTTEPGMARARSREPKCTLQAATSAGSVHIGGDQFQGGMGCYPGREGSTLAQVLASGNKVTVLGNGDFMTNLRLDEDGNAALALNLLGGKSAVTWLVPTPPAAGGLQGEEGKPLSALIPASIPWGVAMACLAVLVTAFWRGRRLGPVVVEKLPVVVRATETVEGRGRLYRARRARERAAAVLRAGTIDRLTPRLGLAAGAGQHEVVAALAVRTGQDAQHVGAALYGPPPADDAGLVTLARYLEHIERIVREH
ncbi:DUF4350 domain-containing protein [Nonomuraea typhae]|uniref:DUF4350 domain-containing protein n=1 Tax=Nonomuraea typhae TaxID=2603600 RepID=UPI0012F765EA|nr:DUF4350 domain-containing protein [Nonomuraea typhae]